MEKNIEKRNKGESFFKKYIARNKTMIPALLVFYVIMIAVFSSINIRFIHPDNLKTLLIYLSIPGIAALGNSFVVISGNFDISAGSILAVTAVIVAKMYNIESIFIPLPLVIIIGLLVGVIIGAINGFLVSVVGINSIIATLGMLAILRGLAFIYGTQSLQIYYEPFTYIGRGYIANYIPLTFIFLIAIFIIFYLLLKFTKFGRNTYAVGANSFVSKLYGINIKKAKFLPFILSGVTASAAGILATSQLAYGNSSFGEGFEFTVLTIVVLGGISIAGGRGSLVGVLIAIFIIGSIDNGLILINIPIFWRDFCQGLILIGAIFVDAIRTGNLKLAKK